MKKLIVMLLILGVTGPVLANEFDLPPGKWWEDQRIVDRVGISAEQQSEIRDVVYERARKMIDLKADVDKVGLDLAAAVDRADFDASAVRSAYGAFQAARHKLENERFEMLLEVRQILSTDQWQKMQEIRRRVQQMRGQQRRPGQRPQGGGTQPGGYSR